MGKSVTHWTGQVGLQGTKVTYCLWTFMYKSKAILFKNPTSRVFLKLWTDNAQLTVPQKWVRWLASSPPTQHPCLVHLNIFNWQPLGCTDPLPIQNVMVLVFCQNRVWSLSSRGLEPEAYAGFWVWRLTWSLLVSCWFHWLLSSLWFSLWAQGARVVFQSVKGFSRSSLKLFIPVVFYAPISRLYKRHLKMASLGCEGYLSACSASSRTWLRSQEPA